ncbi:hypothetical protein [Ruminococcus sp.]|uniref:hypothetical protein n=1 Tax=Ruminococcus sp. TaxID=41978 RepID=UPI002D07862E|nr:hypothetical protein [Ruminococcus sp.]HNZ97936.1 hypothetical protein [Ruminococcus sp.]HOH87083.1 hypothetical protein [Ruminococcus sp.]
MYNQAEAERIARQREFAFNRKAKGQEFAHNLAILNRCKKSYSIMGIVYFIPLIIYFIVSLVYGFLTGSFTAAIIALFECPLLGYLALRSFYSHKDITLILILAILGVVQLILFMLAPLEPQGIFKFNIAGKCGWIHLVMTLIVGAMAVWNIRTNIAYHKLEAADGFPHFNERFFEQEMDIRGSAIKDPYQQQMEDRMRTASDAMSDVGSSGQELSKYTEVHTPSEMDSI